jgi:hypothetical protein
LIDISGKIKSFLGKARDKISGRPKGESSVEEKIDKLTKARERFVEREFNKLNQDRGDGKGTHLENPNEKSYAMLKKLHEYTENVDSMLNRLENRPLVTAVDANGKKFKHEPKRWYKDRHNLGRFKDLNSKARKEFEESLIENVLSKGVKSDSPQAIFMMGGPASGKSTLLDKRFGGNPKGFLVIDSDKIKSILPEFLFGAGAGDKEIAGKVHQRSSEIAREILRRAKERGFNIMWDGTGADRELYTNNAVELKKLGYKTQLIAQHIPERVGIQRAVRRAELPLSMGGGRFVPLNFIEDAYNKVPRHFEPLAKLFGSATISDGISGKQIMQYGGGKLTSEDRSTAPRFRRRYGDKG